MRLRSLGFAVAALAGAAGAVQAQAQSPASSTVYRCPGPPVLYTDQLSAQEARERGCRLVEGTPITVIQSRPPAGAAPRAAGSDAAPAAPVAARPPEARIDPAAQRARDSDAKRILQNELKREEDRLAELKREYNNGEPERRGDERNYQKYLDRVADLKSSIARKESDIAAIKREIAKLPQ